VGATDRLRVGWDTTEANIGSRALDNRVISVRLVSSRTQTDRNGAALPLHSASTIPVVS
jgi:hypothetical protein